ncbi:MAG: hypothetical protein U0790_21585 [Isosphaeraceae bacterium]
MRSRLCLALSLLLLPEIASADDASAAPGNDSIRAAHLKADLFFLAGDRFRGRLTATPENDLASEFIAARFERLGLKPVGADGSYYHRFHLDKATLGPVNAPEIARGA